MNWFQSHAYIATWLSPFVAIAIFLLRGRGPTDTNNNDWMDAGLLLITITALGVLVSPVFDKTARDAAQTIVMFGFGAFLTRSAFTKMKRN